MTPFAYAALAGALCLPATYSFSRKGSIALAVLILVVLGAAGGVIAQQREKKSFRPWPLVLAFVMGAMFSEVVMFAHYYITYGYQDPKLSVGMSISVIELVVISVVGVIALLAAAFAMHRRITRPSKGRAASGAPLS